MAAFSSPLPPPSCSCNKGIAGNQGGRRVAGVIQQHAHHLNKTVFRIADPPDAVILTFGLNGQIPGGIRDHLVIGVLLQGTVPDAHGTISGGTAWLIVKTGAIDLEIIPTAVWPGGQQGLGAHLLPVDSIL